MITWILTTAWAATCPEGAYQGAAPADPFEAVILGFSEEDAWADSAATWVGRRVVLTDVAAGSDCWYSARVKDAAREPTSFFRVAFRLAESSDVASGCPAGARRGGRVEDGERVRVVAIGPDAGVGIDVVGLVGRAVAGWSPIEPDGCWYAGRFESDGGRSVAFSEVAVTPVHPLVPCPPEARTTAAADDDAVKIVAIGDADPRYGDWSRLVGTTGRVSGRLDVVDGCWLSGAIEADDGRLLGFSRVAVWTPVVAPPLLASDRFDGPRVPQGLRVRIVDVHPNDAYFPEKDDLIGSVCRATDPLRRQEPGWFSGEVLCDGGRRRYFLKVAVALLTP